MHPDIKNYITKGSNTPTYLSLYISIFFLNQKRCWQKLKKFFCLGKTGKPADSITVQFIQHSGH